MKENLNDWAKRMRQMAEADCDPQEVWSAVSERLGEVQDRLFAPMTGR